MSPAPAEGESARTKFQERRHGSEATTRCASRSAAPCIPTNARKLPGHLRLEMPMPRISPDCANASFCRRGFASVGGNCIFEIGTLGVDLEASQQRRQSLDR